MGSHEDLPGPVSDIPGWYQGGSIPEVHPTNLARAGGELTRPFTPQQFIQFGLGLIEEFLGRVAEALIGVFIPGPFGAAFTQLADWATDIAGNIFALIDALTGIDLSPGAILAAITDAIEAVVTDIAEAITGVGGLTMTAIATFFTHLRAFAADIDFLNPAFVVGTAATAFINTVLSPTGIFALASSLVTGLADTLSDAVDAAAALADSVFDIIVGIIGDLVDGLIGALTGIPVLGGLFEWLFDAAADLLGLAEEAHDDATTAIVTTPTMALTNNFVTVGDFETDSFWANAWGAQSTAQAYSGTKSRLLTATGTGRSADRIVLTHDQFGSPTTVQLARGTTINVSVALRKHASNTSNDSNLYLCLHYIDGTGTEQTVFSRAIAETDILNSGWWFFGQYNTINVAVAQNYYLTLEIDSAVDVGNRFYLDAVTFTDASAINAWQNTPGQVALNNYAIGDTNIVELDDNEFTVHSDTDSTRKGQFETALLPVGTSIFPLPLSGSGALLSSDFATQATAGGTTTLTVNSKRHQEFTGTLNQNADLPSTSVPQGDEFWIINNSTGIITVRSSAGNTITTVRRGTSAVFRAKQAAPTSNTHWSYIYWLNVVEEASGITSNDNDWTFPTCAAVKDYCDGLVLGGGSGTFSDSGFVIQDNLTPSKQFNFQAASISASTTRTLTVPDANGTLVLNDNTAVITGKTLDGDDNTFRDLNQVLSGTFASLPAAASKGRIYVCTDVELILRDNGSSWDRIWIGTGGHSTNLTAPPSTGWTNTTLGSSTIAASRDGRKATVVSAGGDNIRAEYRALAASSNYTAEATLEVGLVPGDFSHGFLLLRDSGGKFMGIGPCSTGGVIKLQVTKWNSATSYNSTPYAKNIYEFVDGCPHHFRWRDDNTTRYAEASHDRENWITLHSEPRTTFMTAAHVGWGGFSSSGNTIVVSLRHFREF
jgi:hypothetical protein